LPIEIKMQDVPWVKGFIFLVGVAQLVEIVAQQPEVAIIKAFPVLYVQGIQRGRHFGAQNMDAFQGKAVTG
jgi:hypothetical protein